MKKFKIVILLIICLCMCSCSKNIESMCDNLSEKILDAHLVETPSMVRLNKTEKIILKEFLEQQKESKKRINISESLIFNSESYTEEENTFGLYESNGDIYLDYYDISWEETEDKKDHLYIVNKDTMQAVLYKSLNPILYEETKDNPRYVYEFKEKAKEKINNGYKYKYYYKSKFDNTGVVIIYRIINEKIDTIDLVYQDIYFHPSKKI